MAIFRRFLLSKNSSKLGDLRGFVIKIWSIWRVLARVLRDQIRDQNSAQNSGHFTLKIRDFYRQQTPSIRLSTLPRSLIQNTGKRSRSRSRNENERVQSFRLEDHEEWELKDREDWRVWESKDAEQSGSGGVIFEMRLRWDWDGDGFIIQKPKAYVPMPKSWDQTRDAVMA